MILTCILWSTKIPFDQFGGILKNNLQLFLASKLLFRVYFGKTEPSKNLQLDPEEYTPAKELQT